MHLEFENADFLISGGAGFIGSNLVRMILSESKVAHITIVDNLLSSEPINIPDDPHISFIEDSIANDCALNNIGDRFDYVFHLATYHGNQSSIHDPLADHEHNLLATLKLLNHIKSFKKIKKVVYASAGCTVAEKTFGEAKPTPEDAPISLVQDSPYAISKIVGEFYSLYFFRQHGLPTVRARFQNVYGPGEILGAGQWRGTPATVWRNVTPTFIYKALIQMPLPLENEGRASRDFIYVDDICRGLILCAIKGKPGDVYNLASGQETTIRDLATLINKLTENKAGIESLPPRLWDHSGKRYGSTKKAESELGFKAVVNLQEGLSRTIEWTRQNLSVIETCIQQHAACLRL